MAAHDRRYPNRSAFYVPLAMKHDLALRLPRPQYYASPSLPDYGMTIMILLQTGRYEEGDEGAKQQDCSEVAGEI